MTPKAVKLALVFAAVAGTHGAATWAGRQGERHAGLTEGLHALGTVLFGVGIWLGGGSIQPAAAGHGVVIYR